MSMMLMRPNWSDDARSMTGAGASPTMCAVVAFGLALVRLRVVFFADAFFTDDFFVVLLRFAALFSSSAILPIIEVGKTGIPLFSAVFGNAGIVSAHTARCVAVPGGFRIVRHAKVVSQDSSYPIPNLSIRPFLIREHCR